MNFQLYFPYRIRYYIISILLLLNACSSISESERLNNFFDSVYEAGLREYPESATYKGDTRYNDMLTDMSMDAISQRFQETKNRLAELKLIRRYLLTSSDQLNYDLFLQRLERSIERHQFKTYLIPINQMGGIHIDAPNLVEVTPFNNRTDYQNYLKRLSLLPLKFEQTIALMKHGLVEGITPPNVVLSSVPEQIKTQFDRNINDSPFYTPFNMNPGIEDSIWIKIKSEGYNLISNEIFPAYQKIYQFFNREYLPNTRSSIAAADLPNGDQYYQFQIQKYTTTELTAEEIHRIGKNEVARIHQEMLDIIKSLQFKGNFDEFLTFLRTDSRFYYTNEDDLLDGYRTICKKADPKLAALFGNLPRIPYGVKPIPAYQASAAPTAYYFGASDDGSRPGYFWANTYKLESRPKYEMAVLALHEAVPGHHLQISLANELKGLPKFRQKAGYTAFVEGWALYAESLGEEMGMYNDPYDKFGQLTYEMWRACRLVVDTGMHALGWTREEAVDYLFANTAKTMNDIQVEINRYIVWPGQALAYKIGELKIWDLRTLAESELKDLFDIREFHDAILENGALPLSLLEIKIQQYINSKLQN